MSAGVAVFFDSSSLSSAASSAADLAAQLNLPLLNEWPCGAEYALLLQFSACGLELAPVDARQSGPVRVDFCAGANAYRLQGGAELIAKAVRGRSKEVLRVLDATAGLGRDSFVLAGRGLQVHMLERSPVVAALLADGLKRARHCGDARLEDVVRLMSLQIVDAADYLQMLPVADFPDVIYLDPMFPASEKTALVKKEMRLFQQLFHRPEMDADLASAGEKNLLLQARRCARLRVVVKRPLKAQALAGQAPDYALAGKAVRFDVYVSAPALAISEQSL